MPRLEWSNYGHNSLQGAGPNNSTQLVSAYIKAGVGVSSRSFMLISKPCSYNLFDRCIARLLKL